MAAQQRPMREPVEFPPNVTVTVTLKYAQGKVISNQYGERMMYSLADGRVMFLDMEVASQIEALSPQAGDSLALTKRQSGQRGAPCTWEVARGGEQADGTFAVPKAADAPSGRQPGRASLADEANALVDVYADVLKRALDVHQGRIKPEEVRSLLVSAYIQRGKMAGAA
jgi:hypothetical protein